MPVAMISMNFDATAEEQQEGRLSKLAKWQRLELDATLQQVFLAHKYLDSQSVSPVRSGPVRSSPIRSGPVRSGQVRSGQVRSGWVRSGQVRSGQVRSGQVVRSGHVSSIQFS